MRIMEYFIYALTVAMFFAFLFLPDRFSSALALACLVAAGLWALLYPAGMLGWAKTAYPEIDPSDQSLWWLPRLIGACFLAGSGCAAVMFMLHK